MKRWTMLGLFGLLTACAVAHAHGWRPAAGHVQVPIWPGAAPDALPVSGPETATRDPSKRVGGRPLTAVGNVGVPTMTVYPPKGRNTGAAVVVFPGGGFQILAMDLEGTEACDWLTSQGVTCVLLKYRVPSAHYDTQSNGVSVSAAPLADAQRTIRLTRFHAAQWGIDPHKVGVLGFSAGGYLVADVSTHFAHAAYVPVDAADEESDRPDFALAIYPAYLATAKGALNPDLPVAPGTPPTFLVQAEDDHVAGVQQSLVYYAALSKAGVPAEMHLYAQGGHGFGLRPTALPITRWPKLAEVWLHAMGVMTD